MLDYIKTAMDIDGDLTSQPVDNDRFIIYLDGNYYGVYDIRRNTFVD